MSGHKRHGGRARGDYGGDEFRGQWQGMPPGSEPGRRLSKPVSWIVVIVGLAIWSLLAWVGYALVDPVLGWLAGSAGLLVDGGKGIATATGVGKEVGAVVDSLNVSGFLGQAIALLQVVAKPAIVVLWAIGALALIAAPLILSRMGRLLGRRRH